MDDQQSSCGGNPGVMSERRHYLRRSLYDRLDETMQRIEAERRKMAGRRRDDGRTTAGRGTSAAGVSGRRAGR